MRGAVLGDDTGDGAVDDVVGELFDGRGVLAAKWSAGGQVGQAVDSGPAGPFGVGSTFGGQDAGGDKVVQGGDEQLERRGAGVPAGVGIGGVGELLVGVEGELEPAGFVDGEVDVGQAHGAEAKQGPGALVGFGVGVGHAGLHGQRDLLLRAGGDCGDQGGAVGEVPVGGVGGDADGAGGLAQADGVWTASSGELESGRDKRGSEVAVVVAAHPSDAALGSTGIPTRHGLRSPRHHIYSVHMGDVDTVDRFGTGDHALPVVSDDEWHAARAELIADEDALIEALKRLAERRRRLPVRKVEPYQLHGSEGPVDFVGLFERRRQLIVYHFYAPLEKADICLGCSAFVDNIGNLAHLHARDTAFAMVSSAPWPRLEEIRQRMGWQLPWYSSVGTNFTEHFGVDEWAGLSCFIRDDDHAVYQSFFTNGADLERLRNDFNLLDMSLLGRQETWENSPNGWPQTPAFEWWHLHDEYPPDER